MYDILFIFSIFDKDIQSIEFTNSNGPNDFTPIVLDF